MALGLLRLGLGGRAVSSGARAAAGNATRQAARQAARSRMGRGRRGRLLRRLGAAGLIGGLLGSLFGGGAPGRSDPLGGAGGLGGIGRGAGGSGDFDITLPPEVATKRARRISKPTLVTISNQITDLTNIALGIAQVAKEERQVLIASLKAKESAAQEAALESGAEMIPAAGSGEKISPSAALDMVVRGLIATIEELTEKIKQGGGAGGGLGPAALGAGLGAGATAAGGLGSAALTAASLLIPAKLAAAAAPMYLAISGFDAYAKKAEDEGKQKHERGIARFGLTGNNIDGYKINGQDAGQLNNLPLYYQKVVEGYGVARGSPDERTAAQEWVRKHNPDGSIKEGAEGVTQRERELAQGRSINNDATREAITSSSSPAPQPTQTSGAAISIGTGPSPAAAAAEAGTMEAPDQQAPVNAQPSPQTAQPEQPIGQSGAAIDAASQPGPTPTQGMGSTSTPPPTPSPFPTTKPNATGMGNVPEPSYTNMGEIASNLYFGARAEALA